jgi:hypothetical protein
MMDSGRQSECFEPVDSDVIEIIPMDEYNSSKVSLTVTGVMRSDSSM